MKARWSQFKASSISVAVCVSVKRTEEKKHVNQKEVQQI